MLWGSLREVRCWRSESSEGHILSLQLITGGGGGGRGEKGREGERRREKKREEERRREKKREEERRERRREKEGRREGRREGGWGSRKKKEGVRKEIIKRKRKMKIKIKIKQNKTKNKKQKIKPSKEINPGSLSFNPCTPSANSFFPNFVSRRAKCSPASKIWADSRSFPC